MLLVQPKRRSRFLYNGSRPATNRLPPGYILRFQNRYTRGLNDLSQDEFNAMTQAELDAMPQDGYWGMIDSIGLSITDASGSNNHLTVHGFTANWSGTEYLTASHITGSEGVVESVGTSTPSVAAGRINFTAGTCSYLKLSNGDELVIESSPTSLQNRVWDVANGKEYLISPVPSSAFFTVEKAGSRLLARGFSEDVKAGKELLPDLSVIPNVEGITVVDGVIKLVAAPYIRNTTKTGVLKTYTQYEVIVRIKNYRLGNVAITIGANDTPKYDAEGTFRSVVNSGNGTLIRVTAWWGAGTTLDIDDIIIREFPLGLIPASVSVLSRDIFGNILNRPPGYLSGDHILLYAPETQSFYDMAVAAGIDGDLYSGPITAVGLSAYGWVALGVDRIIADYLYMGNHKWLAYNPELSGINVTKVKRYVELITPFSITVSENLSYMLDLIEGTDAGAYVITNSFSRLKLVTSAKNITVNYYTTGFGSYTLLVDIVVLVDGIYFTSIQPASLGAGSSSLILPAGTKTIEFVNSCLCGPSKLGTFFVSISGDQSLSMVSGNSKGGLIFYGDSIAGGFVTSIPSRDSFAIKVREAASYPVAVEAWSGRSLYDDASTSGKIDSLVSSISVLNPAKIWMAIGTNDYVNNKWSAAAFGSAYAGLLDAIHTALPDAQLYCQTPIVAATESANGSGSTLGDYRTQITTVVSARSSFANLVDGTAILTTGDLSDGIHPTKAGHFIYADYVKTVLGL